MVKANYELAQAQQQFKDFYMKNLRQKYTQLEPARQKYLTKFWRRFIISSAIVLGIFLLCCCGVISSSIYTSEGFIRISALAIVGMIFLCSTPFSDYCVETKSLVMDKILEFWGNFSYSFSSTVSNEDIIKSELFARFNSDDTDDSFAGSYKNTKISVAEKDLRIKGNKSDYSVFKGVIILLKFNKKFKGKTVVKNRGNWWAFWKSHIQTVAISLIAIGFSVMCIGMFVLAEDLFEYGLFAGTALFFGLVLYLVYRQYKKQPKKAVEKVVLEEIKFNRKWKVLTDNQVEARYILNPTFMEKINNVRKLFHGKYVDFGFFDSKLLIAVHTSKNMFETTSLFTPALQYHKVREVVSQLHGIFSVIDILQNGGTNKLP